MSVRRVTLIGAGLTALGPLAMSLFTPAMPTVVGALDTTAAAIKIALSIYFAGFALAHLAVGPLSDALGRRRTAAAFMAIFVAASAVAMTTSDAAVLIAARFFQGVGAAAGITTSRALVRDLATGPKAARILNLIGLLLAVVPALGPLLGGILVETIGWRAIFAGMVVYGLGLLAVIVWLMRETVVADASRLRPRRILAAYAEVARAPEFLFAAVGVSATMAIIYTFPVLLPFLLMDRLGLSPVMFGLVAALQTTGYICGALVMRRLMARLTERGLTNIGMGLVAVGCCGVAALPLWPVLSIAVVMLPVALVAAGMAFVNPHMTGAAMAPFGHSAGTAAALLGFGQMGTAWIAGLITAALGDPMLGITGVVPALGLAGIVGILAYRWYVARKIAG